MKQIIFTVLILASFLFKNSQAQWELTSGPNGAATALCIVGDTLFVGAEGLIFMTTDMGETWTEQQLYTYPPHVYTIINANNHLIAATSRGLYRYTGSYWEFVSANYVPSNLYFHGDTLWGGFDDGVKFSTDYGDTWQAVLSIDRGVNAIYKYGNYLFAGSDGYGVFRSSDNGATWETVNNGIDSASYVYAFGKIGSWLYISVNGWVYRSNDFGETWSSDSWGVPDGIVYTFYTIEPNDYYIFIGTDDGVYYDTNPGGEWEKVTDQSFVYNSVYSIAYKDGTLFFAGEPGVYYMNNAPYGYWKNLGVANESVMKFCWRNDTLYAATNARAIQRTWNQGLSWEIYADRTFEYDGFISDMACTDTITYLATTNRLARLRPSDRHWEAMAYGNFTAVLAFGDNVYAGGDEGVYISHDDFDTYVVFNDGLPSNPSVKRFFMNDNYIFASLLNNGVYRLDRNNPNAVWEPANNGIENKTVENFYEKDGVLFAATSFGLYRTSDNGNNWEECDEGISDKYIRSIYGTHNALLAGTNYGGVYISSDNGDTWQEFNENLTYIPVISLTADSQYVYAGTYEYGMWRRQIEDVINDVSTSEILPDKFVLYQNYPNPFNPMTTISYVIASSDLSERGNLSSGQRQSALGGASSQAPRNDATVQVSLKIYDALGREVATLVNSKQAPGKYSVQFNATSASGELPSGIYFYTLRAGNFVQTRKMVLMK